MDTLNVPEDEPITHRMVNRSIEGAQRKVEGHNFDIRKNLLDYDNVMNQQRGIIYGMRRKIMEGIEIERTFLDMLGDQTSYLLDTFVPEGVRSAEYNLTGFNSALNQQFGVQLDFGSGVLSSAEITDHVTKSVKSAFEAQKKSLGSFYDQLLKIVLLQNIDQRWKEHLARVDRLKEGIGLRGYAQKDPVIEYKKEAFNAFEAMQRGVREDTIEKVFKVQIVSQDQANALEENLRSQQDLDGLDYVGADESSLTGLSGLQQSAEPIPAKQKMRMSGGPPPQNNEERQLNRADRRRMKK
jgi:preprotein translocase subunit SecA